MLAASNAFKRAMADNSTMLVEARVKLFNNQTVELSGDDISACSVEQSTSAAGSFNIGSAIIGKLSLTLNNRDGRFDKFDFTDAKILVRAGKQLDGGTIEWVSLGLFIVDQPDSYSGTIKIDALDRMSLFEKPFAEVSAALPQDSCKAIHLVQSICSFCKVLPPAEFANSDVDFSLKSIQQGATCLAVIGYVAQATGNFARVNQNGLELSWYDTSAFEGEGWLDGGVFDDSKPYASGDSADGGDFVDYSSGDSVDSGSFENQSRRCVLPLFSSLTVYTDDVVVTGIRVTAQNEVVTEGTPRTGETYLFGSEGYVLAIANNPLISYGRAAEFAAIIAKRVVGMRFRPFSGKHVLDPTLEAGDPVLVVDRAQNTYISYATSVKMTLNGGMTVSCDAKSASRNSAANAGAVTSAFVAARNEMSKQLSSRDMAIESLGEKLGKASGLYTTTKVQQDGSSVFYLHDKPELADSKVIYKITSDTIGISTDGGKTYATGLSANGDAVLNRIYAIGIDANYIKTGELDASNVRIKNLMHIGSDETGLKLSDNSIVFNAFGKESLEIFPTTTHPKIIELKNDDGTPLLEITGPGSSTYTSDFYPANPHIGKCHIEPLSDGTGYLAWYSVTISIYDPKNGGEIVFSQTDTIKLLYTDSSYSTEDHVFRVPLYVSNTVKISIWFSSRQSVDSTYDSAISVTLSPTGKYLMTLNNATYLTWDNVTGASITDKRNDVTFLTNRNYMAFLNYGHTYTGRVSIPYIRGNTMQNYVMQFDHGLLSDFNILTPTDPGFVAP